MRRLVVAVVSVVVIAALVIAVDLVLTAAAEQRLSERVSRALDAPADAELHGWPLSLHLLNGNVPRVDVNARDVPMGQPNATIHRVDVVLTDVAVRWADLTGEADELPSAEEAQFEARVDEATAQSLLGLPDQIVGLELREGVIVLNVAGLAEVEADVEASDGIVVVRPREGLASLAGLAEIPIDLRDQPGGPHVRAVEVTEDSIVLSGRLTEVARHGGG